MTELDRLRPSYARVTNVQHQARSVVRKYRKKRRYLQLWKLKEMIPNVAQQKQMDEVRLFFLFEVNPQLLSILG